MSTYINYLSFIFNFNGYNQFPFFIQNYLLKKIHWTGAFFAFVGGLLWMFVQGWLSLHTCIHPHSHLEYNNKKPEIEQPKAYVDIRDSRQANDINLCDKVICKSGCRLRAIVRLIISALGFTFLVCGIVVSLIDTSGMGKKSFFHI